MLSPSESKAFMGGVAITITTLNKAFDQPTVCLDVLQSLGLSYSDFQEAKVDVEDLKELRKIYKRGN